MFRILFAIFMVTINAFPSGRCYVNSCNASPYILTWISSVANRACFIIENTACYDPSKYDCCNKFNTLLHKIDVSSTAICNKSVISVTVNGTVKAGGISFVIDNTTDSNSGAELRISSLTMNNSTADGTILCINMREPCNTLELLNSPLFKYAIFDSGSHLCCPTCDFNYCIC